MARVVKASKRRHINGERVLLLTSLAVFTSTKSPDCWNSTYRGRGQASWARGSSAKGVPRDRIIPNPERCCISFKHAHPKRYSCYILFLVFKVDIEFDQPAYPLARCTPCISDSGHTDGFLSQ